MTTNLRSAAPLLLLAIPLLACARREAALDPRAPVIIISVDTLRSDRAPSFGKGSVATPHFDAFARDSIRFESAYAHSPLTLVSHASAFTGTLPSEHGIRDNAGYRLASKGKTIAELAKDRGFATGGAVSSIVLAGSSGIDRGFDFWDDEIDVDPASIMLARAQRSGDATRAIAERWIRDRKSEPFLFFFHIYEPHTPYEPSYDADVAAADAIVGRFLSFLRQEGIYDRATILLLSDHGEGLGDHGEDEHGIFLYREAIQVPLMLRLPGGASRGTTVNAPVQLADVHATIAAAFDPALKSEGRSLLDVARGEVPADRAIYSETFYPRFHLGWSDLHSIVVGSNHYIHGPRPELFDIVGDPAESKNRLAEERRTYAALRDRIATYIRPAAAPSPVDDEQRRQLAALGYLGSTVAPDPGAQLPDPKDNIQQIREIGEAFRSFRNHDYGATAAVAAKLLARNPMMLDLWMMKARALDASGQPAEAIAAAKEGLRRAPANVTLALLVATVALRSGRLDDAESHARLALHGAPDEAHYLLAQVALERNDLAKARSEAEALLADSRNRSAALLVLGRVALARGNLDEALAHLNESLALRQKANRRPLPTLNFYRGDVLARMGRAEEAEAAFREEIDLVPTDPYAYRNLILLYALSGRTREATDLIFAFEKAAPAPRTYAAIAEALSVIGDEKGARYWAARGREKFPVAERTR